MASNTTLYFGYGSNLWKDQMLKRCPTSTYLGIARLNGYRWIINNRGYANVIQPSSNNNDKRETDSVWGLVYSLEADDQRNLDINEGVPYAYTKETMTVDYWPSSSGSRPNATADTEEKEMLVYIDRKRTRPDRPRKEYIHRMNMGTKDAVAEGMPLSYVKDVMRKFIPDNDHVNAKVKERARKQAVMFEDEQDDDEDYDEDFSEDEEVEEAEVK